MAEIRVMLRPAHAEHAVSTAREALEFQRRWTEGMLTALSGALSPLPDTVDPLAVIETFEDTVGLGFVAMKSFIARATDAFEHLRQGPAGIVSLRRDPRLSPPLALAPSESTVSVIWGMADYFKHHDRWPPRWGVFRDGASPSTRPGWLALLPANVYAGWDSSAEEKRHQPTLRVLAALGINSLTHFPCLEALSLLRGIALAEVEPAEPRQPQATADFSACWSEVLRWYEALCRAAEPATATADSASS